MAIPTHSKEQTTKFVKSIFDSCVTRSVTNEQIIDSYQSALKKLWPNISQLDEDQLQTIKLALITLKEAAISIMKPDERQRLEARNIELTDDKLGFGQTLEKAGYFKTIEIYQSHAQSVSSSIEQTLSDNQEEHNTLEEGDEYAPPTCNS